MICRIPLSSPSIYICVHEPLLPDEFGASSRPVVAYVPGVMFSGPVARGFETSAMPLRSPVLRLIHYPTNSNIRSKLVRFRTGFGKQSASVRGGICFQIRQYRVCYSLFKQLQDLILHTSDDFLQLYRPNGSAPAQSLHPASDTAIVLLNAVENFNSRAQRAQ